MAKIDISLDGCQARGPSGSKRVNASPARRHTHTSSPARKGSSRDKWWVATAILPGQLTIAFGMFGVVVALPNIMTAFGTDVQTVQWVMTGYLVARVIPMPTMGWLVSQLGQRNLYVLGVLGTTVSTALCGLAWNMESLIVCRIVQVVEKTIDVPGLGTMTLCLVALLLALSQGQQYGWGSPYILGLLAISGVLLGLFLMMERRATHPVVPLRLYRNRPFVLASVVVFLYNAGC